MSYKSHLQTYCDLSTSVVRNAFEQVRLNLELSRSCVSKRVDSKQWYVFYCRYTQRVPSTYEFPTPVALRLRSVTIDACKYNISFLLMVTITSIKMLASHNSRNACTRNCEIVIDSTKLGSSFSEILH